MRELAYPTFAAPLKAKGANARRAVELAKFNLECEPHGRLWDNYSVIVRLSFAHCLLIIYSFYIVLFVFLIFTSSKFFILLSGFNCISVC